MCTVIQELTNLKKSGRTSKQFTMQNVHLRNPGVIGDIEVLRYGCRVARVRNNHDLDQGAQRGGRDVHLVQQPGGSER